MIWMAAAAALSGCAGPGAPPEVARLSTPEAIGYQAGGPPNAPPGTCWGRDETPAVVETVTVQIPVQAEDSAELSYREESEHRIIRERGELWFETPCEADLTPDFIGSVQRALAARGLYFGSFTGALDAETKAAVRRFQARQGLNSAVLSMAAARQLGLVAINVPRALPAPDPSLPTAIDAPSPTVALPVEASDAPLAVSRVDDSPLDIEFVDAADAVLNDPTADPAASEDAASGAPESF